jgi:hypothetical protein
MNAQEMAQAQRGADRAHHLKRVEWLEGHSPVWSCGASVKPSDRQGMLRQSKGYLADPSGSFNHCQCEPRCA